MQTVYLIENPLEPATWEKIETEDVRALLTDRFVEWPATARIYEGRRVGQDHDVTPTTEAAVDRLVGYPEVTVVVYPEGPVAIIAAIVVAVAAAVAIAFMMPSVPDLRNTQTSSPNNSLAERSNRPRPNARIPDIFGTLRSVPDMISVPYRVYEDHRELEISYMCIGRGAYDVSDVRDGDTLISDIAGASLAVYGPETSPNNAADVPQLQIGTEISDPIFNVTRLSEVNGQEMKAPNDEAVRADNEIQFADGGIVEAAPGIDFTDYFAIDDEVEIGKATDPGGLVDINAILAAATAEADGFTFATYDPTINFAVGQVISITQAVYTIDVTSDPTGGDLAGGTTVEDYPYDPYSDFDQQPV